MLQNEYIKLAKSVDYVSEKQAKEIITIVLDKIKVDANAAIAEVWIIEHGQNNDILKSYVRRSEPGIPIPQNISLTETATGLLVWVAEKKQPIWINDIEEGAKSGRNLLTDKTIDGRYFNLYDRTRAFAAVQVEYRDQLRAILTVEVTDENRLEKRHVDILREISEATGILIWKASVFIENEKQTDDAMEYLRTADTKPSQPSARHRTGFIARPFEKSFDFIGRNIEDAFRSRQVQATIYRPAADSPFVAQEMLEQISIAHFGIADITSLNQNVLIEIGVMIGISKPTIILKRKDDNSSIPFNIAGRQCFLYEQTGEEIFIYDAALKKMHLQEFIVEFVDKLSSSNRDFRMARRWFGS